MEEDALPSLILLENVVGFEKHWSADDGDDGDDVDDMNIEDEKAEQQQQKLQSTTANEGNTNDNKKTTSAIPCWAAFKLGARFYHSDNTKLPIFIWIPRIWACPTIDQGITPSHFVLAL